MGDSSVPCRCVVELEEIAVGLRRANKLLGLGPESRWLMEPGCPVPGRRISQRGTGKPVHRWLVTDLRAFVESRRVLPGQTNPQALNG